MHDSMLCGAMHVYMHVCMHVCMYAGMYACMHACMHVFTYRCDVMLRDRRSQVQGSEPWLRSE